MMVQPPSLSVPPLSGFRSGRFTPRGQPHAQRRLYPHAVETPSLTLEAVTTPLADTATTAATVSGTARSSDAPVRSSPDALDAASKALLPPTPLPPEQQQQQQQSPPESLVSPPDLSSHGTEDAAAAAECGELRAFCMRGPPLPPFGPNGKHGAADSSSASAASLPRSFWRTLLSGRMTRRCVAAVGCAARAPALLLLPDLVIDKLRADWRARADARRLRFRSPSRRPTACAGVRRHRRRRDDVERGALFASASPS